MATAGQDFDDYRRWLEAAGVDTSLMREVTGKFTASFFCSTDTESNQIASFYTGAMANAGELSFRDVDDCELAIISPNDPGGDGAVCRGVPRRSASLHLGSGPAVRAHVGAELQDWLRRLDAHHLQRLRVRAAAAEDATSTRDPALEQHRRRWSSPEAKRAVRSTRRRPQGCSGGAALADRRSDRCRRCLPCRVHEGAVAARRAREFARRMGAVAATYALEHLGGQSHAFTWAEFVARYEANFGRDRITA